jgi:hypothetical protein
MSEVKAHVVVFLAADAARRRLERVFRSGVKKNTKREQRLHVKYWIMARRSRTKYTHKKKANESKHSVHKICERTSSFKFMAFEVLRQ